MQALAMEKDIRKEIKRYLEASGWFVYWNLAGPYTYKGLSDLVAIKQRRGGDAFVLFLEIKGPVGRQSEDQVKFQNRVSERGGHYFLARSLDGVIEYLDEQKMIEEVQQKLFKEEACII